MNVAIVSNFFRRADGPPPQPVFRPAYADEVHAALGMVLGSATSPADPSQVTEFVSYAQHRGINLGNVWIAIQGDRLIWAILPLLSPGRTMLLLTPPPHGKDAIIGALIDAVCETFGRRGVQLAQALLDPANAAAERLFAVHGFRRMAELLYLHGPVRKPADPALRGGFSWATYSPQTHSLFASTIAASYHDSLDCPGLNGLRDIADVIEGHKASGEFDPGRWYVLQENGVGLGALLLSRLPHTDAAELVYLGLSPQARGRRLADLLMKRAFSATAEMGLSRLSLAVDSGNAPALRLYYRFGMAKAASKIAMMRVLSPVGGR